MDNIECPNIIMHDLLKKYIDCNDSRFYYNVFIMDANEYEMIINNFIQFIKNKNNFHPLENFVNLPENTSILVKDNIDLAKDNIDLLEDNIDLSEDNIDLSEDNIDLEKNNNLTIEDPWETSINDDKFYINNKVARIFPVLKNFNNFSRIKIDDDSFSYITIREIAELTTKIICYHLLEFNLNPQKIKIVDYTSGVGGNVLSFSKYFNYVYAVEISQQRSEYLENNIGIYGYKNIKVINKCAIDFNENDLIEINPSVIFIDPPWGGCNYKNNENLQLKLGNMSIEELIINISKKFSDYYIKVTDENPKEAKNNFNNKLIILKLPKNYDIEFLYSFIKNNNNLPNYNLLLHLYILNKMLIVVCQLEYKYY